MTILRICTTVLASITCAALVLAVVAVVSVATAASTGTDVVVPGLVDVTAGHGADLASASLGGGVLVWFTALTIVFSGAGLLWLRRGRRRA